MLERKIFKETKQLNQENLFKNIASERCYYGDIEEGKIDRNSSEEIEHLLNYKDIKEGKIYENNLKATEQFDEKNVFNTNSKKLIL